MSENKSIVLRITNMKWVDKDKNQDKLPSEVELQWASDKWDYDQVSNWLNNHFNNSLEDLMIKQIDNVDSGGG
ncbi:MAG: hypothetical protein CMG54_04785 [Candidatus Marinimicrobia bacterium]|nr:hypothetical protein [Candidatus Neomarinimicrobiota bacterium]|tara:strand:- start:1417 stop:1635 length:219 start_codon:yes stop_codon:yes gene_type:complete